MAQNKYLSWAGLEQYDREIKALINEQDSEILEAAKEHAEGLGTNYDPAGTAATKVQELADGQVKQNKDDIDALKTRVGTSEGDITTMKGQIEALEAGVYDDAEVRELIGANADDIDSLEERATTAEGKISTLIGEDQDKSVRTIANEELAKQLIPESAKESLDTLAEISAWIQSHPDDASAMNAAIEALETKVDTGDKTVSAYVTDAINALAIGDYAKAADLTALAARVSTIESDYLKNADKTALQTAITDCDAATLASAKEYTDETVEAVANDVSTLFTNYGNLKAQCDEHTEEIISIRADKADNSTVTTLSGRVDAAEADVDNLQAAIGEGGSVTLAIADAKTAGTTAQAAVTALETGAVATLRSDVDGLLEDTYVAITTEEIASLFAS